jgi:hypothetical protein
MTTQDVLDEVVAWFSSAKLASLELPDGWFGRPHDNLHQLTWSAATGHKVLLELDRQLLLVLTEPRAAESSKMELRILDCAQVVLDWQEYGSLKLHVDNHHAGSVRFAAQGAGLR